MLIIHRTVLHDVSSGYSQDSAIADQRKLLHILGSKMGDEFDSYDSTMQIMYELRLGLGCLGVRVR